MDDDILVAISGLLEKFYSTDDNVNLMLERLEGAGVLNSKSSHAISAIESSNYIRNLYQSWVKADAKAVLNKALWNLNHSPWL